MWGRERAADCRLTAAWRSPSMPLGPSRVCRQAGSCWRRARRVDAPTRGCRAFALRTDAAAGRSLSASDSRGDGQYVELLFDAIDHRWLLRFVEHRIADGRLLRLIRKWLAAGVMEDGKWAQSREGTPQGATISPLLANIYLHYALDLWVQQWRRRHGRGEVIITRYADDFIVGFQHRSDAERFLGDLRERLRRFSLELHPEKTRLIEFGRYAAAHRQEHGLGKPATFNFLGFTHICGKRKAGGFLLTRRTMRTRMQTKLHAVKTELQRRRHQPIPMQGQWLGSVVRGYFAYHAVPTNIRAIDSFRKLVTRHWFHSLRRRSQRTRMNWARMDRLSERWLPRARVLHPWPVQRFEVRTRGRSPVR